MNGVRKMNRLLFISVFASVLSLTAMGDDPTMKAWSTLAEENRMVGTMPTNAVVYRESGNWIGGTVAQNRGEAARFPEVVCMDGRDDGLRFVTCSGDLTVGDFVLSKSSISQSAALLSRVCFLSDDTVRFLKSAGSSSTGVNFAGRIYADINQGDSPNVSWHELTEFCGDYTASRNLYVQNSTSRFRLDYYAKDGNEVRVNPINVSRLGRNPGPFVLYAPKGSDEQQGVWSQTAGSPFLFRTGGDAHPLAVGTQVRGTGIPAGTFLRRVFSDSMIELSASVETTVIDNAVMFAAFSPKVYQSINEFYAYDAANFGLVKYRSQDVLRVEALSINEWALSLLTTDITNLPQDGETWYPGTLVVHDASPQCHPVQLGDCHLEFAETGKPDVPSGIPNPQAVVSSLSDTSVSRLTATNGISAVMTVKGLTGTFVKDGEGTLTLTFVEDLSANTGSLSVEAGRLELVCEVAGELNLTSLTVAAGATLKLPTGGLSVGALDLEEGAIVEGPGVLSVRADSFGDFLTFKASLERALTAGATLVFSRPGSVVNYDSPATNVVGNPAFWVDVSRAMTIDSAADADGVLRVSALRDVRAAGAGGGDFPSAIAPGLMPELMTNAQGQTEHIYFERVADTKLAAEAHALIWDRSIKNICVVFKVACVREGGGQLLGGAPFRRNSTDYSFRLFATSVRTTNPHPELYNGQLTVNGEKRDWIDGYAYPGGDGTTPVGELIPQVIEFQMAERTEKCVADNFDAEFNNNAGQNGGLRLYECLVYTNMLTETEKAQVRGYLMQKWLNAEATVEELPDPAVGVASLSAADAGTIGVGAGSVADIGALSGSGRLVKTGAGTLYVDDLSDAATSVEVVGGTLTVRSFGLDRADLPDGAAVHFDAADLSSLTTVAHGSRTRVQEWRDWRGMDYPSLVAVVENRSNWPGFDKVTSSFTPVTINGYKTVHMGDSPSRPSSISDFTYLELQSGGERLEIPDLRTVVGVYHSLASGGIKPVGVSNDRMVNENGHTWGIRSGSKIFNSSDMKKVLPYSGAGATRVRLNGADKDPLNDSYVLTGDNLLSLVTYEQVGISGLGIVKTGSGAAGYVGGRFTIGETIAYRRALSRENARRVEAYLQKKWFNIESVGYRPAVVGALKVGEGATLNVYGSAPITASSVSCAGTIAGSVALTANAVLDIPVRTDGTVAPMTLTGGTIDLSKGGTIRLVGCDRRLTPGSYVVLPASSMAGTPTLSDWTFEIVGGIGRCSASLRLDDGALVIDVLAPGVILIVR